MIPVITIDGPSGSGKGTISKMLADRLGWHFLDSGAIYRVLALSALQNGIDEHDFDALINLANNLDANFVDQKNNLQKITIKGTDVTDAIRQEGCGIFASHIAALPAIRHALLQYQRNFRKTPGLVADGRDMGTIIFPDAKLKIFLTASVEERAKRRQLQLQEKGINVSLNDILRDLVERDARDEQRAVAPLKIASDAIVVDTTNLSIEEVLQTIIDLLS